MSSNARRLLDEAMRLPSAERVELYEHLGARLEAETGTSSEAWRVEVARRVARLDAGQAHLLDAEELERELWAEQLIDEAAELRR